MMMPLRHQPAPLGIARLTLGLMLLAASLIILGGVRFARRERLESSPADRTRLQEFTDAFHSELERLEELFQEHLSEIATQANSGDSAQARALCARVAGVRAIYLFRTPDAIELSVSLTSLDRSRVPEVAIDHGKSPKTLSKPFIVPATLFANASPRHGWLKSSDIRWRGYWQRISPTRFVVLLIESTRLLQTVRAHLQQWLPQAFAPIQESGELVRVRDASGVLVGIRQTPGSPMALKTTVRSFLGSWEISAWDRIHTRTEYSPAGISATLCAGALLPLLAILLYQQQHRAFRLAEERVSFVNRVSHELGTPLTNALLNLSLAEDSLEFDPDRARTRLRLVSEEIQRLARLVSNVLTFSKINRGTLTLCDGPCIPDLIVSEVLAQFEPALRRHGMRIEWKPGAPESVLLCADALAQITGNLLSNAEKYAHSGGWIGIRTDWNCKKFSMHIADLGPGIPEKDCARIFDPFERISSHVHEGASGTGLGLSIAREMATRMGGSLRLLPSTQGACFELEVPAQSNLTA